MELFQGIRFYFCDFGKEMLRLESFCNGFIWMNLSPLICRACLPFSTSFISTYFLMGENDLCEKYFWLNSNRLLFFYFLLYHIFEIGFYENLYNAYCLLVKSRSKYGCATKEATFHFKLFIVFNHLFCVCYLSKLISPINWAT